MLRRYPLIFFAILAGMIIVPLFQHSPENLYAPYGLQGQQGLHGQWPVSQSLSTDGQRRMIDRVADTMMQRLNNDKYLPVSASAMNEIHFLFGQQLQYDRKLQALLQNSSPDSSLTQKQYGALTRLLASSALYEKLYQQNTVIQRSLNRGDMGNNIPRNALQKSRYFLFHQKIRKQSLRLQQQYSAPANDSLLALLPATGIRPLIKNQIDFHKEFWHTVLYNVSRFGSKVFGRLAGKIQGPNEAPKNAIQLAPRLQAFDIMLMKAPQRLTDRIIPGYFGHVSICLGTDALYLQELVPNKVLGTYSRTFTQTAMTEAVRKVGVRISRLEDFAEGKVFLVLRPDSLTEPQKKKILTNILKQLNKRYDFHFNLNSLDEITCTELIFLAYDEVNWPLEKIMGLYTLSPDGIFKALKSNGQFHVPVILNHGQILNNPTWSEIDALMRE